MLAKNKISISWSNSFFLLNVWTICVTNCCIWLTILNTCWELIQYRIIWSINVCIYTIIKNTIRYILYYIIFSYFTTNCTISLLQLNPYFTHTWFSRKGVNHILKMGEKKKKDLQLNSSASPKKLINPIFKFGALNRTQKTPF